MYFTLSNVILVYPMWGWGSMTEFSKFSIFGYHADNYLLNFPRTQKHNNDRENYCYFST